MLLRAGLLDAETYLDDLAEDWPKYLARPGRNVTPLSELSFEAWIKLYKPADNHTNRTVSYYEKGKWAALVLELLLREATEGRRGVEDLFRRLWADFGQRGPRADRGGHRGGGGGSWPAGRWRATSPATSGARTSCRCRRCCGGRAWRWSTEAPWQDEDDADQVPARLRAWSGITWAGAAGRAGRHRGRPGGDPHGGPRLARPGGPG